MQAQKILVLPKLTPKKSHPSPKIYQSSPPIVKGRFLRWTISHGFSAICLLFKIEGWHFVLPGTEFQNTPGPCTPRRNLWYEWKLFIVACRHANMIVFGWEVESFAKSLVLSGECYWCCNSMEGFFTRLSYFFTRDFETYTMNMKFEQGFWGPKGTLSIYF